MAKNKNKEKKDKPEGAGPLAGQARLLDLVVQGDFRAARAQAKKTLADAGAPEAEKAAAREVLSRISVEKGALVVGLVLATVLLVIATLVLR
jgi:hypothetical protein